jgi:hypothetical protein
MATKVNTTALKKQNRIELVLQEAEERFSTDPQDPNFWVSLTTYGLVLDLKKQTYTLSRPGFELESGDVFSWLMSRYGWPFKWALNYLQQRKPDPVVDREKTEKPESHFEIDRDRDRDLDPLQRQALQLAGEEVRQYFRASWLKIADIKSHIPSRFMGIVAVDVSECVECGQKFDWQDPATQAYIAEGADFGGQDLPDELAKKFFLDIWIEEVLCRTCVQKKLDLYLALEKCEKSAWRRA